MKSLYEENFFDILIMYYLNNYKLDVYTILRIHMQDFLNFNKNQMIFMLKSENFIIKFYANFANTFNNLS
jgi:hypothetical protein